ncbi:MAG TPA: alpha/beta hydrolase [Solimonas sp.]|nr:alpha/beta hydrolase [Solimonas sp.]
MHHKPQAGYQELTQPWEWRVPGGPMLRGRRADGPGPQIHFLSGTGFCGGVYWPMLRQFLPAHGLFIHDLEGHGASDAPAGNRFSGIKATVTRAHAVIREQGLEGRGMIGMGHSFGGALTVKLAADYPGLFRALVLLDPILFPTPMWLTLRAGARLGMHPMAKAARRRRTGWPSRQAALDHLRGRGIYKGWSEEALACFVDHAMRPGPDGAQVLCCPPELEANMYEHPVLAWSAIRKLDIPVLYLRGAQSYSFFERSERTAARSNPRVELQTVPGEHCFMQEHPGAAHAAIAGFLGRVMR